MMGGWGFMECLFGDLIIISMRRSGMSSDGYPVLNGGGLSKDVSFIQNGCKNREILNTIK